MQDDAAMFTRLKLTNFKSFREADIPLGPFTLIIGANASGKSRVYATLFLLLAVLAAAAFADTYLLRLGNGLDPTKYMVEIEAKQHIGAAKQTIKASYEFTHQALKIADDGRIPTLVTFGPGEGMLEHKAGKVTLSWSYGGAQALLMFRPNSRLTQALTALKEPAEGASMDVLAGYALAAWSIPLLEGSVEPGATIMNDLTDEPAITGKVLVYRRVITTFDHVREIAGAPVAFLSAICEQKLADDHPTLSGSSIIELKAALDLDTGRILAADATEAGEVTVKNGPAAGAVVTTDELQCRIRIADGPEIEFAETVNDGIPSPRPRGEG